MKSKKSTERVYYIEPIGAHTNQVIAESLGEKVHTAKKFDLHCLETGRTIRYSWEYPDDLYEKLRKSAGTLGLEFRTYIGTGKPNAVILLENVDGAIITITVPNIPHPSASKVSKEIETRLRQFIHELAKDRISRMRRNGNKEKNNFRTA